VEFGVWPEFCPYSRFRQDVTDKAVGSDLLMGGKLVSGSGARGGFFVWGGETAVGHPPTPPSVWVKRPLARPR
jgi:hypothetical protein